MSRDTKEKLGAAVVVQKLQNERDREAGAMSPIPGENANQQTAIQQVYAKMNGFFGQKKNNGIDFSSRNGGTSVPNNDEDQAAIDKLARKAARKAKKEAKSSAETLASDPGHQALPDAAQQKSSVETTANKASVEAANTQVVGKQSLGAGAATTGAAVAGAAVAGAAVAGAAVAGAAVAGAAVAGAAVAGAAVAGAASSENSDAEADSALAVAPPSRAVPGNAWRTVTVQGAAKSRASKPKDYEKIAILDNPSCMIKNNLIEQRLTVSALPEIKAPEPGVMRHHQCAVNPVRVEIEQLKPLLEQFIKEEQDLQALRKAIADALNDDAFMNLEIDDGGMNIDMYNELLEGLKNNTDKWTNDVIKHHQTNLFTVLHQLLSMVVQMIPLLLVDVEKTVHDDMLDEGDNADALRVHRFITLLKKKLRTMQEGASPALPEESSESMMNLLVNHLVDAIDKASSTTWYGYMCMLFMYMFDLMTTFRMMSGLGVDVHGNLNKMIEKDVNTTLPFGVQHLQPGYSEGTRRAFANHLQNAQSNKDKLEEYYEIPLVKSLEQCLTSSDWNRRCDRPFETYMNSVARRFIDDKKDVRPEQKLFHTMSFIFTRFETAMAALLRQSISVMQSLHNVQKLWTHISRASKSQLVSNLLKTGAHQQFVQDFCKSPYANELLQKKTFLGNEMTSILDGVATQYSIMFGTILRSQHFGVDQQVRETFKKYFAGQLNVIVRDNGEPEFKAK